MEKDFDKFTADLAAVFGLPMDKCERLAEILDDRMREIADKQISDAMDREFRRGQYDPDY